MLFGGRCVCFPGDLAVFICKGRHTPHLIFCPRRVVQGLLTGHAPITGEETETQGGWETEARPHAGPLGTPGTK